MLGVGERQRPLGPAHDLLAPPLDLGLEVGLHQHVELLGPVVVHRRQVARVDRAGAREVEEAILDVHRRLVVRNRKLEQAELLVGLAEVGVSPPAQVVPVRVAQLVLGAYEVLHRIGGAVVLEHRDRPGGTADRDPAGLVEGQTDSLAGSRGPRGLTGRAGLDGSDHEHVLRRGAQLGGFVTKVTEQ